MAENYPTYLIPYRNLTIISEDDLDLSHHLGKWVKPDSPFRNADGKLDYSAIPLKRLPGCSSNKIPNSKPTDLYIEFKSEFAHLYKPHWIEGEDGLIPDNNHFERNENRNIFFIKIGDIHNLKDSYSHPTDKTKPVYSFIVKVIHKPLVSNYWHFELIIKSDSHQEIKSSDPKWREKICTTIMDEIQEKAIFELI
jgi:hypothetical protein